MNLVSAEMNDGSQETVRLHIVVPIGPMCVKMV
jgi:hypothetical protein